MWVLSLHDVSVHVDVSVFVCGNEGQECVEEKCTGHGRCLCYSLRSDAVRSCMIHVQANANLVLFCWPWNNGLTCTDISSQFIMTYFLWKYVQYLRCVFAET